MAYADITTRDPNPIKRWLQRHRLLDALAIVQHAPPGNRLSVLDYGAGNGELLRLMGEVAAIEPWAYEPTPSLLEEARQNLAGVESAVFLENLDSTGAETFDCVFCLEVFEHLPEAQALSAIADIDRLLKPDGFAVIGVPHELFLPALLKGLFRMFRRYGDFDATPGRVLRAALGHPPSPRPVAEIMPGLQYHFHHLGFDYRALERMLEHRFRLKRKWFSPFPGFGAFLNSEVYFLLEKA